MTNCPRTEQREGRDGGMGRGGALGRRAFVNERGAGGVFSPQRRNRLMAGLSDCSSDVLSDPPPEGEGGRIDTLPSPPGV